MGGAAAGCAGAAAAAAFVTLNTSRFWPTATQGEGERGKDGIARARNDDGDDAAVGGSTTDPLFLCGESVRASVRRPLTRALASSLLAPSRNTCACSPSLRARGEACCRHRRLCFHSVHAVAIIIIGGGGGVGLISNSSSSSCACLPPSLLRRCPRRRRKQRSTVKETTTFHDSRFYP